MDGYDELFKTIESYPNMKIEYLQFSKIGKGELYLDCSRLQDVTFPADTSHEEDCCSDWAPTR